MEEAVCLLLYANIVGEGMRPNYGLIVGRIGSFVRLLVSEEKDFDHEPTIFRLKFDLLKHEHIHKSLSLSLSLSLSFSLSLSLNIYICMYIYIYNWGKPLVQLKGKRHLLPQSTYLTNYLDRLSNYKAYSNCNDLNVLGTSIFVMR